MLLKAQPEPVRIRITVAETDLKDALVILNCYSCAEYDVHSGQSNLRQLEVSIAGEHRNAIAKVEIVAKCTSAAVAALLEELVLAFGHTQTFTAERD